MNACYLSLLLTLGAVQSVLGQQPAPTIEEHMLKSNQPVIVRTAPGLTTTLQFPKPIRSVDGEGLTEKHDNTEALFVTSFTRGVESRIISFSPLYSNAKTNVNITVGDEVYVIILLVDPEKAVFKVAFNDAPALPPAMLPLSYPGAPQTVAVKPEHRNFAKPSPAQLLGLIDKCKAFALLQNDPRTKKLTHDIIVGTPPWAATKSDGYEIQPLQVFRKGVWDALVFEVQITNTSKKKLQYDPLSFAVNAGGPMTCKAAIGDAAGSIAPKGSARAWFVVYGDGDQGSNNLSAANPWTITIQTETGDSAIQVSPLLPPIASSQLLPLPTYEPSK